MIYELIGRVMVRLFWQRYGRRIKVGVGVTLLALVLGGYFAASRDAPEG